MSVLRRFAVCSSYCLMDPTWVDPGFGTNEEFRDLVAAAHGKNIRVVMDIVINHVSRASYQ